MKQSNGGENESVASMTELQAQLKEEQELNKDLLTSILGNADAQDLALFGDQHGAGSARNPLILSDMQKTTLINSLLKENSQLSILINHMTVDRNNAQSKAMLIEQQSEETAGFKTMVKDELEEHLREIRKALILKESLIQKAEFEKQQSGEPAMASYIDPSALLIHRDIVTPSVGLLRIHEDTEVIKKEISKRVDEIQELQRQRKVILSSTKAIRFQVALLNNALLSSSYKKKQCLLVEETTFSDDEDYNGCYFKSKITNFNREYSIQKIKEEKRNLQQKGLLVSDVSPNNNAMGTLRTSKIPQLEIEIEKYSNLSAEYHKSNEAKLKALAKIDRYNQSLLKSNAQLVEGSIRIQTKSALTNHRLRTYKRSYQTLLSLKRNRFRSVQQTFQSHNNTSCSNNNNNSSTGLPGSFIHNNNQNESSISPGMINSNSSRGNGVNLNPNGVSLANIQYNSSGLCNINNGNVVKLLSVAEEDIDENIDQRRTLSPYQSLGSKANTDICSVYNNFKDKYCKNTSKTNNSSQPWMSLKQSIEYLFKVKQQLDRCCKQAHYATAIATSDPRYVSPTSIPQQICRIRRAVSTCCDGSTQHSQMINWQKDKVAKPRNVFFLSPNKNQQGFNAGVDSKTRVSQNLQDEYDEEYGQGQLLQLPEETDETEEEEQKQLQLQQELQKRQISTGLNGLNKVKSSIPANRLSQVSNSSNYGDQIPKQSAYRQSYEGNKNEIDSDSEDEGSNGNQQVFNLPPPKHNNSFFRELDISVIQVQTKGKRH